VSASAYVERYGESDKAHTGLGEGVDAWPVPYWHVDGGMSVMAMLLATIDRGLGALFFGIFEHEHAVRDAFAIPDTHQPIGTLAVGHPAPDAPGRSSSRPKRDAADVIHLGSW
jgi:nitroreductase